MEFENPALPPRIVADAQLVAAIDRLKHITGFVTTLTTLIDPRAQVFNRFDHVIRVLLLSMDLCKDSGANVDEVAERVWLHDINRWVFAHNAEKSFFDQSQNIRRYLAPHSLGRDLILIEDLEAFHNKDFNALTLEGRIALLADMITGIVEDPLLAICGLNVSPSFVPQVLLGELPLPVTTRVQVDILRAAAIALHVDRDIIAFSNLFSDIHRDAVSAYLDRFHGKLDVHGQDAREVYTLARRIKVEFMQPLIFPINNDGVCHGSWLKSQVIGPLIQQMGYGEAEQLLLTLDEPSFVEFILTLDLGSGSALVPQDFIPDLDYVSKVQPAMRFIDIF